jgi:hypothetical protein
MQNGRSQSSPEKSLQRHWRGDTAARVFAQIISRCLIGGAKIVQGIWSAETAPVFFVRRFVCSVRQDYPPDSAIIFIIPIILSLSNSFHFSFFNNYSILIKKRLLWNINGMAPPGENTEEERVWKRENRAVPPEEMDALKAKTHGQL